MTTTRTRVTTLAAVAGAGVLLLAACSGGTTYGGGSSGSSSSGSSSGGASTMPAGAPGKIAVGTTPAGKVLVDPHGRTIYVFAPDSKGHSTCTGSCARYWPPVPGADAKAGRTAAVTATLGTAKRSDGSSQLTVDGLPVYTYVGDQAAGDAKGQGVNLSGGLWWVVSPAGKAVTGSGSSGSSGGASSSSGSSSRGGY